MKLHNKDVIIELLTKEKHLRDNDRSLIANIWWKELTKLGKEKGTAFELLKVFTEGKLSNPESIRRCRQKVQEENPSLRGNSYYNRHKEEKRFREEEIR